MSQHDDNSDDFSGDKSPFSEATVVHSSNRPAAKTPETRADVAPPADLDRTVIHAQSNLKEAFDARTVVQVAKPPKGVAEPKVEVQPAYRPEPKLEVQPEPAPKREAKSEFKKPEFVKPEYPKPELPKEAPARKFQPNLTSPTMSAHSSVSISEASFVQAAHLPEETGGAIELRAADHTQTSTSERRAMRAQLDRKTRFMIAGFAAAAALGLAFVFMGNGASDDTSASVAAHAKKISREAANESEMASTSEVTHSPESERPTKVGAVTQSGTTTDVLARFERSANRAQEKAAPSR